MLKRIVAYFEEPGPQNTEGVIEAVVRRVEESGVDTVVVASTSGRTGVKFVEALRGKAKVVAVSHERMDPQLKRRIVELGGIALDGTHLPLHERGMDYVRNAFYTLGQGFSARATRLPRLGRGVMVSRLNSAGCGYER